MCLFSLIPRLHLFFLPSVSVSVLLKTIVLRVLAQTIALCSCHLAMTKTKSDQQKKQAQTAEKKKTEAHQ